jgi:hypothetical protein
LLFRAPDGFDPIEWTFVQRRRSVLLVGMFRSWCVDAVIPWSKETENQEEETGDNKGINDRSVDRTLLDL